MLRQHVDEMSFGLNKLIIQEVDESWQKCKLMKCHVGIMASWC